MQLLLARKIGPSPNAIVSERCIFNGVMIERSVVEVNYSNPGMGYGLGFFETIAVEHGVPLFLREHVERLSKAAAELGWKLPYDLDTLHCFALELINAESSQEASALKIVVADFGRRPDVLIYLRRGIRERATERLRLLLVESGKFSTAFSSKFKTLNYAENWLSLQKAWAQGYDEVLFRNERGDVAEAATANIFFVKANRLFTPSLPCGLLDGITRSKTLQLAEEAGISSEEGCYSLDELIEADEIFLTNSLSGIVEAREIALPGGSSLWRATDNSESGVASYLQAKYRLLARAEVNHEC